MCMSKYFDGQDLRCSDLLVKLAVCSVQKHSMQASTATVSHDSFGCIPQLSSRRHSRHGLMRARVATLERKETLRGLSMENNDQPDVQSIIDNWNIRLLEASYQRHPEHPPFQQQQQQQATVADLVHSSGLRHGYATQLRRARRSSRTFAASGVSALETNSAGYPAVDESSIGVSSAESLRTIMDLWHMLHEKQRTNWRQYDGGTRWWQDDPPRLLTAEEERVLGTVVQQHRKLQQLYDEHPAAAAQLETPNIAAHAFWSKDRPQMPLSSTQSNGSSSSSQVKVRHGNIAWPPPLTAEDSAEVSSWSFAWRAMLPDLAQMAQQLLVSYNSKLVLHMRKFATSNNLPWEDLLQAGLQGLKVAAQRYNPDRKTRFSTMATLWILQAMNRTASNQTSGSRLPERYLKLWRHVLQTHGRRALADIDNRADIITELSTEFSIKPATVLRILKSTSKWITAGSLDGPAYTGPKGSKGDDAVGPWSAMVTAEDLDDDEDADGDAAAAGLATEASYTAAAGQIPAWLHEHQHQQHSKTENELQLHNLLSVLKPLERQTMMLLYGLSDLSTTNSGLSSSRADRSSSSSSRGRLQVKRVGHKFDAKMIGHVALADVAEQMGYTPEGVRQIRLCAMRKLKAAAKRDTDTDVRSGLDAVAKLQPAAKGGTDTNRRHRSRPSSSRGTESANSSSSKSYSSDAAGSIGAAGASSNRLGSSSSRGEKSDVISSSRRTRRRRRSCSGAAASTAVEAGGVDTTPSSRMESSSSRDTESNSNSSNSSRRKRRRRGCDRRNAAGPQVMEGGGMDTMLRSQMGSSSSMPTENANNSSSSSGDCVAPDATATERVEERQEVPEAVEHFVCTLPLLPKRVAAVIQGCPGRVQPNLRLMYHYYTQYNCMPARNVVVAGWKLGQWCYRTRSHFSRGQASASIVDAFECIAPGWLADSQKRQPPTSLISFRTYHAALLQYLQEFNALPNKGVKYQGLNLGNWVQNQRYRCALMSQRNRQALESVPGWEWLGQAAWRGQSTVV